MIRAVGQVIYTYQPLEIYFDSLWDWLHEVEQWYGESYSDIFYSLRRNKLHDKFLEATASNRKKLRGLFSEERPWNVLDFGAPKGILHTNVSDTPKGIQVSLVSYPRYAHGLEAFRRPSYLSIIVDPLIFRDPTKTIDFINLGMKAWSIVEGVYGFIDLDTGIPPNDNLIRNIACIISNLIPSEYLNEFKEWHAIMPHLNKRIWKVFWGNYLGEEHLQNLGGYDALRKADYYRPQSEILKESLENGRQLLIENVSGIKEWTNSGYFFQLSSSPLEWESQSIQETKNDLQKILNPISITTYNFPK